MKKIRPECLGMIINYKANNGVKFDIEVNENDIEFYSTIGLDIFQKAPFSKSVIVEEIIEEEIEEKEIIEEVKPLKKKNAPTKPSK